MALTEELPIYKATYDLVLVLFNLVKNFNRENKYTIGESLKKEAIEAGSYDINFAASKLPSGILLLQTTSRAYRQASRFFC
jgi:hypothetical protein